MVPIPRLVDSDAARSPASSALPSSAAAVIMPGIAASNAAQVREWLKQVRTHALQSCFIRPQAPWGAAWYRALADMVRS